MDLRITAVSFLIQEIPVDKMAIIFVSMTS